MDNPGAQVEQAVEQCLEIAATWLWARFSEQDLEEAQQRLRRLGMTFALRIAAAGPDEWDRPRTPNWTLREICEHLTGVVWYAEQVGRLPR